MYRMVVLSGSSHQLFATILAERLGIGLINVVRGKFANGETRFELRESVRGADVYIVQTNCEPVNDMLMELMIMIQTCRYAAAHRIYAVLPLFPYSRQDKIKTWLQPITAKLVASMLTAAGVNHVLTMNLHTAQLQGFFEIPCDNLNAQSSMITWLRKHIANWQEATIVAPDNGSVHMAMSMSSQMGVNLAIMHKQRQWANEVQEMILVGNVRNKVVVVIDDMTDTGNTLCFAAEKLHEAGASKMYACVTHGVFSNQAVEKLLASRYELCVCTNTVPMSENVLKYSEKFRVIDVTNIFAKYIKSMHEQRNYQKNFRLTTPDIYDENQDEAPNNIAQTTANETQTSRRDRHVSLR